MGLWTLHGLGVFSCVIGFVAVAGCGGGSSDPAAKVAPKAAVVDDSYQEPTTEARSRVDSSGRRWLTTDIPYDVYPDLPSADEIAAGAILSESMESRADSQQESIASVGTSSSQSMIQGTPVESGSAPQEASSVAAPVGADEGWDQILPLETLQAEITAVRNRLGENLLTVGTYNSSFEEVSNAGWEMSALTTIASEHAASISWKGQALFARDAAVRLAMAATSRGRENFNAAELASEQVFALLNNNPPPGLSEPDPETSREETADRAALMTRIQTAFDELKGAGATETTLRTQSEVAIHEARLLGALARFTADSDYTAAENADYQSAVRELVEGAKSLAGGAESGDLETYQSGLDRVSNACNQCHTKYRFSN